MRLPLVPKLLEPLDNIGRSPLSLQAGNSLQQQQPERTRLTSSVSFSSNRVPASPLEGKIRSFSICGHIPVGLLAEPAGKDKIAVLTTFVVTVPDVLVGLLGVRGVVRRGCFSASCCRVSAVSGAMLSSEHTARTAPLTSPNHHHRLQHGWM